jgi:hypothetical protein
VCRFSDVSSKYETKKNSNQGEDIGGGLEKEVERRRIEVAVWEHERIGDRVRAPVALRYGQTARGSQ